LPHPRVAGARVHPWAAICGWWFASRVIVVLTAIAVQSANWPRAQWSPSLADRPLALLTTWDGRWYRMIAERGYLVIPHHQSDTAFFPFYPMLLRAVRSTGLSVYWSGLLVANIAFLVALIALYELVRCWADEPTARRAAVYAAIFPLGYVFSMVYPEAVVLAAMAASGALAARGRWLGSAAAAAVAALTRPEALFLVLPLGALAFKAWPSSDGRTRFRALSAVAAAPAAVAGICLYDWRTFGNPLAFSSAQRAWGRRFDLAGPKRAVVELVHALGTKNTWLVRDLVFCVIYLLLLVAAWRVVPAAWVGAAALIVLLPVFTGSFTSDGRFGLVAPPIYAGLARVAHRRSVDLSLRVFSIALLVVATTTVLMRWP
jgi:hypothetical protein